MELHRLLKRQLSRAQFSETKLPDNPEKWLEFIERVNKIYIDNDQDRYLLERSMDISSQEMMSLNEKLEHAQHIARLGYWYYDENDQFHWSKELYNMFNYDPVKSKPSYQDFLQSIHKDDREKFQKIMSTAQEEQKSFNCEIRVKNSEDNYHWYRTVAQGGSDKIKVSGIFIDINKEKINETKIKELNEKLLITARQAGMSEIATAILHNIGNILNSSNVSINILLDSFSKSPYQKLFKIFDMLKEHTNDLKGYITNDTKGQLIPEYLIQLSDVLSEENQLFSVELNNIFNDLKHIKEIVAMQQSVSGIPGIVEKIYIPESIETAINMSLSAAESKSICIQKKYLENSFINADKSKLLQILINIIKNAKDAVINNPPTASRQIEIVIEGTEDKIIIYVIDNGVGIDPDNLVKIFSFGFSTKETGHGFGLHSSALSAQEMGGSLQAKSAGLDKGATFILTLPKNLAPRNSGANNG